MTERLMQKAKKHFRGKAEKIQPLKERKFKMYEYIIPDDATPKERKRMEEHNRKVREYNKKLKIEKKRGSFKPGIEV